MSWAQDEMYTADLGDSRLNARLVSFLERLAERPGNSIPAACRGLSETVAGYRFLDNDKVTFEKVLQPHHDATLQRIQSCPVVLLAQDTTEMDKAMNLGPKGMGTIKEQKKLCRRLHPTVAFTPERLCLGVVHAQWWGRDKLSPRQERRGKDITEKESQRWIDSYQTSCALQGQAPQTLIVNLADAEGDLYEWFVDHHEFEHTTQAQWIVRAAQDRRLVEPVDTKLWSALSQAPALGSIEVEVKARPNQRARMATVTLRATTVTLRAPARKGYTLPDVSVNGVLAREEGAAEGVEPLEWLLLTSLPVATLEQARTVVEWYGARWCIEVFFNVLKNGCQVSRLQLETEERLLPCIGLYLITTWRVLYSLMLGRTCPDLSCEVVFDSAEWQAVFIVVKRCQPPSTAPCLGEMVELVASLGGYMGRKHDGPPGPKTMWIGLQRMHDFVVALEAQRALTQTCV
ncbi:transposase [Pseudomonas marginalis ICMP 11289]|nr:transposase [Pseudomonas marginalis ICMP 11289]